MNRSISPQAVYDSADRSAWLLRDVRELFAYRTLLRLLVINQFKQRYRRSVIGPRPSVSIRPSTTRAGTTPAKVPVTNASLAP